MEPGWQTKADLTTNLAAMPSKVYCTGHLGYIHWETQSDSRMRYEERGIRRTVSAPDR